VLINAVIKAISSVGLSRSLMPSSTLLSAKVKSMNMASCIGKSIRAGGD